MMQYYTSTILLPTIGEFLDSLFCGPFDVNTLQKQRADSLQAVCLVLCSVFTSKGPQIKPSKNSHIALFIVAMALVLYNYQTYDSNTSTQQQTQRMSVQEYKLTILSSLFVALRMLLNLDFQLQMRSFASMVVVLSGSLLGYLFWSMYTSDLTAKMTTNPPPLPIRQVMVRPVWRFIFDG